MQSDKPNQDEGNNVPLTDNTLIVDISDALSEKDKVKFTVHTRTTMKNFQKLEFLVVRQHEEFIWLHDRYEEDVKYAGYIVSLLVRECHYEFQLVFQIQDIILWDLF